MARNLSSDEVTVLSLLVVVAIAVDDGADLEAFMRPISVVGPEAVSPSQYPLLLFRLSHSKFLSQDSQLTSGGGSFPSPLETLLVEIILLSVEMGLRWRMLDIIIFFLSLQTGSVRLGNE